MTEAIHVIPLNDLRDHVDVKECWCKPIADCDYENIFVHNALDGREAFERGERLPS